MDVPTATASSLASGDHAMAVTSAIGASLVYADRPSMYMAAECRSPDLWIKTLLPSDVACQTPSSDVAVNEGRDAVHPSSRLSSLAYGQSVPRTSSAGPFIVGTF